jgi:uncharacterized membrane protein YqhA
MDDQESPTPQQEHPLAQASRDPGFLLRLIASSRFVFALAVFGTFIVSVLLVFQGTVVSVQLVLHALQIGLGQDAGSVRTEALEMVDIYLVAIVLFVISMGFYQLLIMADVPLPPWLRITSPAELETKLIGVLVTVMGVETLVTLNSWDGSINLLGYGVTAALAIIALAFYTWAHRSSRNGKDE